MSSFFNPSFAFSSHFDPEAQRDQAQGRTPPEPQDRRGSLGGLSKNSRGSHAVLNAHGCPGPGDVFCGGLELADPPPLHGSQLTPASLEVPWVRLKLNTPDPCLLPTGTERALEKPPSEAGRLAPPPHCPPGGQLGSGGCEEGPGAASEEGKREEGAGATRPADGAPLSELSWSSSLAVVAVSFSGLLTVIVLMLACLCCKKGGIGFKEFENAEGEEYAASFSAHGSPAAAARGGPDVYVLPLAEVSLPVAKQPGRSAQLLKSTDLGRHSLLYLKEIGHGWFGKVFLGEATSGASSSQVVVKELKPSASMQEQTRFLQEAQPYRALKHSNLLPCLAQCAEVTPYLLVMEFCPLGDLKGYLRSCRVAESMAPDPLTLQRMACEVACGVLHLHHHNYVHSDLALRNCLLSADLTVKIGDYGLSHCKYREDYFVTADQLWVPLRWIAPELVDEVHSNLLVVDQTKASNVWALGVTIWELFELGMQPFPHHSDRQVLAYAIREQQLKLPKPQLQLPLSDRWYEVMQFCWLQPELRPTAEEVHLLLAYLCAKGATEAEEEFDKRWRSLRPGPGHAARLQALCAPDAAPPGVVPVLSAHSPSVGSEYFIRLEEPTAGHDPDCAGCVRSPLAACDDDDSDGSAAASLAMEPLLGRAPPAGGPWGLCDYYPRRGCARVPADSSRSPSPQDPMLAESSSQEADWGAAAFCPGFFEDPLCVSPSGSSGARPSPGGEDPGEAEARRVAQHRHWRSNVSANNNSRRSCGADASWGLGCADGCPGAEQSLLAHAEPGGLLAQEELGEPLLGPQTASSDQDPDRCLSLPHLCSAEGLAPGTITSPWAEAALSEGNKPEAEPRLAAEAGASHGPQPPPPSVPSPSQEGTPLPAQEAPPTLPALPTPAAGDWATVTQLTVTPDSGSSPPEPEVLGSEDEDTTEATSGDFTDLSSDGPRPEKLDGAPAFRSLQKQVGTPDSLDSLDIPSSASDGGCEVLSPSVTGTPGGQPRALDSGYDTENYESPEFVFKEALEVREPEAFGELASEAPLGGGLNEKNPYRDSAYFSDLDTEPEPPTGADEKLSCAVCAPALEPGPESPQSLSPQSGPSCPRPGLPEEEQGPGPREASLPPLPEERSSPEPSACLELQGPAEAPPSPSPGRSKSFLLTPVPPGSESDLPEPKGSLPERTEVSGSPGAPGRELAAGLGMPRAPLCLALPGLVPEGRPEEEDEDSEDSDESDEELCCYSIQEPSEESEEEVPPVPVVVAERQSARNLRSLLKMPSLLSEAFCEDLERKKKAVSFFDDVTVYLFDQESPTRELGEPFPGAKEAPPAFLAASPGSPSVPGRLRRASDHTPDGTAAEEGGGREWDDGFSLTPAEVALATALGAAAEAPTSSALPKPASAGPFSRFTVSPAPGSRFSITQVSDSDVESVGGLLPCLAPLKPVPAQVE
ncbi:serine/threonine-protein kinase LMTK1 [Orycteropus afer afer]|uniref:non-specific serine/threonine protein kinase n=1 Tax=Orycteropus afer afer TaxID=1230840 RepID=A0A8B7BDD4_ORYAF|nr:serine/threonine-protein kinase LMTK1 [Orycteropus afer afer]